MAEHTIKRIRRAERIYAARKLLLVDTAAGLARKFILAVPPLKWLAYKILGKT